MVVDQEIEQIAQDLPEDKQHHEVGAGDHAEQHADRNADRAEIPAFMRLLIHVIERVGVDDGPDGGDQHHHDGAKTIDIEADR